MQQMHGLPLLARPAALHQELLSGERACEITTKGHGGHACSAGWPWSGTEVLTVLVDDYEAKHHPIGPPEPIAAIEFALEQRGLSRKALEGVIGSSGRISEVMNKQRPLTLAMIRKLVETFELPADVLIRSTADSRALSNPSRVAV